MAAFLAITVTLAGCGRSESYRYRLTLAVDTPDSVKRGSSVTEWVFWEVSFPASGTPHKLRGDALYLDLGPGARPLIALLTMHLHPKRGGTIWDWPMTICFLGSMGHLRKIFSMMCGALPGHVARAGLRPPNFPIL
jgi:hypothetical protein